MTALFDDVIITVSETPRSVQFWADLKLGTLTYKACVASMTEVRSGEHFRIHQECPRDLADDAWMIYQSWRDGGVVNPTHTVHHMVGERPRFDEVTA